ncbi:Hypothetical_protein [Hexamita inflata]|uniref:Hypothetical_protein n=1 Tax=Hexamita inflata TaxID=28002 RepID=A0AA86NND8_9EUKA|nr:Hypothetical protein HINF_LOCUS9818 [Hexamita inflata]
MLFTTEYYINSQPYLHLYKLIKIQLQSKYSYISHSLNFRLYQFGLLYRNCKFTRIIISFRYTYTLGAPPQPRQPTARIQASRCNVAASCKPIYTGIHLRRTICVSKEAMERLPLSNPEGSLTAAQHFEPGILPSATDLAQPHLRKRDAAMNEKRNRMNSSSITLNATSALILTVELNRSYSQNIVIVNQIYVQQVFFYNFSQSYYIIINHFLGYLIIGHSSLI